MRLNIKTTNIELTDALSNYINKRISKLDKFVRKDDTSAFASVEIGTTTKGQHTGDIFRAEINLHTAGNQMRAVVEESDLYAAIDEMQNEIIRILNKNKDRRVHLLRRGGQRIKEMIRGWGKFGK